MNQWLIDFISGSISGICGLLIGHPLDTIKCRMQFQPHIYTNSIATFKLMAKEEKLISLFKGVIPPIFNQFPINAM